MKGLSLKQKAVLDFYDIYFHTNGWMPTIRETSAALGYTYYQNVTGHMDALIRKGYIVKDRADAARSVTILFDSVGNPYQQTRRVGSVRFITPWRCTCSNAVLFRPDCPMCMDTRVSIARTA